MIDDWLLYSLLAGVGVAIVASALGCFVVWRRMSYFGDTLAHSSLLGLSLGVMLDLDLNVATLICVVGLSLLLVWLQTMQRFSSDTLLGVLAHSGLSAGLVIVSFTHQARLDIMAYLFGDILAVNKIDLYWIFGGGILILSLLCFCWRALLSITIHKELARVEGFNVVWYELMLTLMIALVIAIAMKIVGVLLITSLMIIPAAAAQKLAHSPTQMLIWSIVLSVIGVNLGISASWNFDTPASPSIVVACFGLFLLSVLYTEFKRS